MDKNGANHHASDATFDQEVIRADRPVMVDSWAPWCAPCVVMGRTLDEVAPKTDGRVKIVKVNVDESPQVSARFGIRSIPSLVFFREGKAIGSVSGALPAPALREALDLHADGKLDTR